MLWFDPKKGIGFIKADSERLAGGKDLFIHYHYILHRGFKTLARGDRVEFSMGTNHRGPCVKDVRIVDVATIEVDGNHW